MGSLKTITQISSSLNKLAINIEAKGVDEALMKRGEAVEYEDPADVKKRGKFEICSDNGLQNPLFGGNMNTDSGRIKMGSASKSHSKRRFYSPT
mgnify:CR=1 FL=1